MANKLGGPLLAFLQRMTVSRSHGALTDGELLQRFAAQREESAFATLMHRHGSMVLGVCQSILQDTQDAEDVFQATFLVLVRKPRGIVRPASVASWLHGVAYRLAMKARVGNARRRSCERQAVTTMPAGEPYDGVIWRDLRRVLHEEVDRLPERFRLPFVLCHLEGKTNEEAAELLGWPKGTVLSSLSRARERLRARLTRRGLSLSSGMLGVLLSQNLTQAAVPAALTECTLKAALVFAARTGLAGGIAVPVLTYADGMLRTLFVVRFTLAAVILTAFTLVAAGGGAIWYHAVPEAPAEMLLASGNSTTRDPVPVAAQTPSRQVSDRDALQGTWIITAAEQQGRKITVLNDRLLVFADDRFSLTAGRGEVMGIIPSAGLEGDFLLKGGTPKQMDLRGRRWHLHGIYLLQEKRLKLCFNEWFHEGRPADFASKASSKELLLTLEKRD
jgi:RNA polymerase sigma factor (sigma-70 family)